MNLLHKNSFTEYYLGLYPLMQYFSDKNKYKSSNITFYPEQQDITIHISRLDNAYININFFSFSEKTTVVFYSYNKVFNTQRKKYFELEKYQSFCDLINDFIKEIENV